MRYVLIYRSRRRRGFPRLVPSPLRNILLPAVRLIPVDGLRFFFRVCATCSVRRYNSHIPRRGPEVGEQHLCTILPISMKPSLGFWGSCPSQAPPPPEPPAPPYPPDPQARPGISDFVYLSRLPSRRPGE